MVWKPVAIDETNHFPARVEARLAADFGVNVTDPEVVRDTIGATLVGGANISITPNDAANTITIAANVVSTTDPEVVRDTVAATLVAGANVTITPDDAANTITISATGGGGTTDLTNYYTKAQTDAAIAAAIAGIW